MKWTLLTATLLGASLVAQGTARAQTWTGSAAVASLRGYTASPGLQTMPDGRSSVVPLPRDEEAMATTVPGPDAAPASGSPPRHRPAAAAK